MDAGGVPVPPGVLHEAGVPKTVLHLLPGSGAVGAALVKSPKIKGVAFTGGNEAAWSIQKALADRRGGIVPFIAETGGLNAMIADSSALPEQVVRDAFQNELTHGQIQSVEVAGDSSILAVVGDGMMGTPGIAAKVFGALAGVGLAVVVLVVEQGNGIASRLHPAECQRDRPAGRNHGAVRAGYAAAAGKALGIGGHAGAHHALGGPHVGDGHRDLGPRHARRPRQRQRANRQR